MFEENAQGIPLEMEPTTVSLPPAPVNWRAFAVPAFAGPSDSAAGEKQFFAAIFVASCFLHGAVGLYVKANASSAPARLAPPHQVEIELAHPPPPPPPPAAALPEPPPPTLAPPPRAQKTAPTPAKQETVASNLPPQEPMSALPVSDEGTLPPAPAGTVTQVAVAPVAAAAPAPPAPIVEAREGANYAKNPRPAYPHLAQREEWEGTVTVRVQVLPSGRPGAAQVQKSAGHSVLDEAAVEAVKGWSFVPATQGGRPVAGWVTVPIAFQLH